MNKNKVENVISMKNNHDKNEEVVEFKEDILLDKWAQFARREKDCDCVLDIKYFCYDYMHQTKTRRKQLEKYYRVAPLLLEKIEKCRQKVYYLYFVDKMVIIGSAFIEMGYCDKAYKLFKTFYKRITRHFKIE